MKTRETIVILFSTDRFTSQETFSSFSLQEESRQFEKETGRRVLPDPSRYNWMNVGGREGEGLHEQLTVYIGFLLGIGGKRRSREAKTKRSRSRRRRRGGGEEEKTEEEEEEEGKDEQVGG